MAMRARFSAVVVALGLVGVMAACSGGSSEPTGSGAPPTSTGETPPATTAETPPPPPPAAEARAVWDEPSFELRSDAAGPFTAGQEGHFTIRLTPRGAYHVNHDYPISVTLTGPSGVTFPHSTLSGADAQTFTEQLAAFDVPFTAPAGAQHVTALVDFAVCTPEACMPDTRTVAIDLDVN
jgi:hypothetical protein